MAGHDRGGDPRDRPVERFPERGEGLRLAACREDQSDPVPVDQRLVVSETEQSRRIGLAREGDVEDEIAEVGQAVAGRDERGVEPVVRHALARLDPDDGLSFRCAPLYADSSSRFCGHPGVIPGCAIATPSGPIHSEATSSRVAPATGVVTVGWAT